MTRRSKHIYPFDPVRSRETASNQWEGPVGGLTQVGSLSRCPAQVLWVVAGANGIGMLSEFPRPDLARAIVLMMVEKEGSANTGTRSGCRWTCRARIGLLELRSAAFSTGPRPPPARHCKMSCSSRLSASRRSSRSPT
jgi:hypothetical protein